MSNQLVERLSQIGSYGAVIGALFVALNLGLEIIGYSVMFASSIVLLVWSRKTNNEAQSIMYALYLVLNAIGIFSRL